MPREASKCREWEKERRDRLSNSFSNLGKKLPCYQPSVNLSKIEILQKAACYIEELELQIKEFVNKNANKISCEKIKKLRDEVKRLLIRNEQLCNLLKDAGIRYPSECGTIKFKSPKKWANKISPEQAKILADKEAQKENQSKPQKKAVSKPKKIKSLTPKQKASAKRKERKKIIQSAFRLNIAQTNLLSITNPQSCFIISNTTSTQSSISKAPTVLTNSRLFSTPLVASTIKQSGTLLVANTNILPVIHQPILPAGTLLTNTNQVLVNSGLSTGNLSTVLTNAPIIVNSSNVIQKIQSSSKNANCSSSVVATTSKITTVVVTSSTHTLKPPAKILPILRAKAYTSTTQINKVPIPALSSEYNKTLLYAANLNKSAKPCANKKKGRSASSKKSQKTGIVITQNIVLTKAKENNDKDLDEDKEITSEEKGKENSEVPEPAEKKIKLDENNETSKKNNTLTYSIDALCNEATEVNKNREDINHKEVIDTETNLSPSQERKEEKENKDEKQENDLTEANNDKEITPTIEEKECNIVPSEKNESELQKEQETTDSSIQKQETKAMDLPLHSELSNDIFASLSHVAAGGQNPESTSPTAAFLLAFPLVSSLNSLKVTEVIEDEATDSQHGTPTLLQIGTMDTTKTTQSHTDNLTPNLLNLDNFSFFSKEFYPSFDSLTTTVENANFTCQTITTSVSSLPTVTSSNNSNNIHSVMNGNNSTAGESKRSVNDDKYAFVPKLQKTATTTTQVYSVAKSETTTYTTSAMQKDQHKLPNKEKNYDLQHADYATSSYNLSYSQPFFLKGDNVITNTISNTSDKLNEKSKDKKPCYYAYAAPTTTSGVTQYNTFNPFTDIPIKTTTSAYINPKPINNMLYTNNTNYSYSYPEKFNTNYSKTSIKNDNVYCGLNYDNYDYKNYDNKNQQYCYHSNQNDKNSALSTPAKNNSNGNTRAPVNWMTTPDIRQQDFVVPPIPKEMDYPYPSNSFAPAPQTTYFNANAPLYTSTDFHNTTFPTVPPNTFQRNDVEENQFSWSPSKLPHLLDQQHNLVATTLPTLVGDLALGTNQPIFSEQKAEKRPKEAPRRNKVQNFDTQNSFLSVSQLVDHNKNDVPARVSNRRPSGSRSSKPSTKAQKKVAKSELPKDVPNYPKDAWSEKNGKYDYQQNNWNNKNRNMKNPSSNYSAEALIGHQNQKNQSYPVVMNKSLPVPFLAENLLPYFPVDIPQDNLMQQNQNYHNFPSSIQNSVYPNNSFAPNPITTSYLPSANLISDITSTDYHSDNFGHGLPKFSKPKNTDRDEKRHAASSNACSLNTPKKTKKKQTEGLSGLVDFSFIPVPGAINSPILPDDFHSHTNFLAPPTPTQLYPCKNPLYPKQGAELGHNLLPLPSASRSGVPHPEISPSLNSMSSSVSNFNLSTIFPEINKGSGAIMDMYTDMSKS